MCNTQPTTSAGGNTSTTESTATDEESSSNLIKYPAVVLILAASLLSLLDRRFRPLNLIIVTLLAWFLASQTHRTEAQGTCAVVKAWVSLQYASSFTSFPDLGATPPFSSCAHNFLPLHRASVFATLCTMNSAVKPYLAQMTLMATTAQLPQEVLHHQRTRIPVTASINPWSPNCQ